KDSDNIKNTEEGSAVTSNDNAEKLVNRTNIKPQKNEKNSHKNDGVDKVDRPYNCIHVHKNKKKPVVNPILSQKHSTVDSITPQNDETGNSAEVKNITAIGEVDNKASGDCIASQSVNTERRKRRRYRASNSKPKEIANSGNEQPNSLKISNIPTIKNIEYATNEKTANHTGERAINASTNFQNRREKKDSWLKKIFGS
ncbi:MAG: hypothetical protein LBB34_03820, partial [Holosporales bacterium]|nr:hypothetical protein [Holosporales bacterium]